MHKVTICSAGGNRLEVVIDPSTTLRYVRKPALQPCFLKMKTTEDATLVVEIDGQTVGSHSCRVGTKKIPLSTLAAPRPKLFGLFPVNSKPLDTRTEPTEFSVFVRRGNEDGALIGTYSFKLMTEEAFDREFESYIRLNDGKSEPTEFSTDESAPNSAVQCWNCRKPIAAKSCCPRCGCEQKDEAEQPEQ